MKKQDSLIEWSGCIWVLFISGSVMALVYYFFLPFARVLLEIFDYSSLISGF